MTPSRSFGNALVRIIAPVAALAALLTLALTAIADPAPAGPKNSLVGVSILLYHRFDPTTPASTTVTTPVFEEQLEWLQAHHVAVIPLRSLVNELKGTGAAIDSPSVVICADDGHQSVYTQMFPLIKRYRIPVTLFIYPSAISHASYALTWEELKEMEASGLVEVQSHTYWHPNFKQERARQSPAEYQKFVDLQLVRSKQTLESRMGHPVDLLAWPYGIHDPDLEAAATRAGYVAAFSLDGRPVVPGMDPMAIPRFMIGNHDRGPQFAAIVGTSAEQRRQ